MKQEYERLQKLIKQAEGEAVKEGKYRNGFHIMPPTGWLNDPNGLCQLNDEYHLFFQYSPLDARGGMKAWGHYVTKDFVNLHYAGAPFVPDEDFDKNGVYSGSSYVDEQGMHIFYTGNVKLPGDYDYVNAGRRADTVLVESKDGINFSEKCVIIDTDEYPEGYSCHIRDPKVWKEDGSFYMVLGARTEEGVGQILIYVSADMHTWQLYRIVASEDPFGYMWECPDIFRLQDSYVVSFSPQGLDAEEFRYQNTYQSGYVLRDGNPLKDSVSGEEPDSHRNISLDNAKAGVLETGILDDGNADAHMKSLVIDQDTFVEWDMGFDFYAPQTFEDNRGRRILIGWAGVPDPGYDNGEVEEENWQHCFTVPRCLEIREGVDGKRKVFQTPIAELEKLRTGEAHRMTCRSGSEEFSSSWECVDICCSNIEGKFEINLAGGVKFDYDGGEVVKLSLSQQCGQGRRARQAKIDKINSLRLLVDSSIVEFYVNGGELVFTTRYYKDFEGTNIDFDMSEGEVLIYSMKPMKVE